MDNQEIILIKELPLISILRGIRPEECLDIGFELFNLGFRIIEIPLNSPEAFKSIEKLVLKFKDEVIIGAGTIFNFKDALSLRIKKPFYLSTQENTGQIVVDIQLANGIVRMTIEKKRLFASTGLTFIVWQRHYAEFSLEIALMPPVCVLVFSGLVLH